LSEAERLLAEVAALRREVQSLRTELAAAHQEIAELRAEMTARFMTIFGTARRQGVALLDWLVRRREAALAGIPGPLLLAPG
jgi:predicted  nucleic acid-binding Zn-ribbon protein